MDFTTLTHAEVELFNKAVQNKPFSIIREKGITYKFYQLNHEIVRIDFTNRCKTVLDCKIVSN